MTKLLWFVLVMAIFHFQQLNFFAHENPQEVWVLHIRKNSAWQFLQKHSEYESSMDLNKNVKKTEKGNK